ncbi:MAG TPA: SURF1 family protein [Gammaproteobacteria bacterium]|jgi:cytochrome oxidase assembly protein ShyY1|nr:SURF1 family protein [Gammaproteobacteria bacterium]
MKLTFGATLYSIKIHKSFLALCAIFFILFLMLSSWQLQRYHYKKNLLQTYETRLTMQPKPFNEILHEADWEFLQVSVAGQYENSLIMLVQNHLHDGKLGFEVLTPMHVVDSNKLLLVDRGWVEKPLNQSYPMIPDVQTPQQIVGYLKSYHEYQFILGNNILEPEKKPLVMQKIDMQEISNVTKKEFYPYVLRLNPDTDNGFVREWVISSVPPARHVMYALQWLAFALVVMIGFVYFSLERVTHE